MDQNVIVYDATRDFARHTMLTLNELVTAVCFSPDDSLLAVGAFNGCSAIYSVGAFEPLRALADDRSVWCVAWLGNDAAALVGGTSDGSLVVWNTSTGKVASRQEVHSRSISSLCSLSFTSSFRTLLTGGNDCTARVFDVYNHARANATAALYGASLLVFRTLRRTDVGALVMQRIAEWLAGESASLDILTEHERTRIFTASRITRAVRKTRLQTLRDLDDFHARMHWLRTSTPAYAGNELEPLGSHTYRTVAAPPSKKKATKKNKIKKSINHVRMLTTQRDEEKKQQQQLVIYKHPRFGSDIPFAEPAWYQGAATPYYTPSHAAYRDKLRAWYDAHVAPNVHEWDEKGELPPALRRKAYADGVYGIWPAEYGGNGPRDADIFHAIIAADESCRMGSGGFSAAFTTPTSIALPPVLAYGSDEMKRRVAPPCVRGEKVIALALTEPWGGSDLANLRTTAERDGDYYVVNGAKKFITGGAYAEWLTTAVRTGPEGSGMGGVSLLLIERSAPGVRCERQQTQGWWMSATTRITFDNVRVPVANLIGDENRGFLPIMTNFNMERFMGIVMCVRFARVCLEDAVTFARRRVTFGRPLIERQIIRHKVAEMARQIEATQAWTEALALQYKQSAHPLHVGRLTMLLKVHATKMTEFCTREASQIIGGASYVRGGVGERVERIWRESRVMAIGGGSEEILLDAAMRLSKL